jgi:hypothetical protein
VVGADGAVIQLVTRCSSEEEFVERFARFTTENDVVVPALPHVTVGTSGQFVIRLKDQSVMMKGRCEVTEIRSVPVVPGGAAPAPGTRALMRLRLREMDAHSAGIHLRLMERHASVSKPPTAPPPAAPEPVRRPSARLLTLVPPIRDVPAPTALPRQEKLAPPPPPPPASSMQVVTVPGARSLRGAPPPVRAASSMGQTSVGAVAAMAPAPPEAESTEISQLPRHETRAAGAAFTLPANPLSDLDADDLAGFIESTLLEGGGGTVDAAPLGVAETMVGGAHGGGAGDARAPAAAPAPASAPRTETRAERAGRIARRVAPYAACVLAGVWLGIALRPSAKVAVVVGAPNVEPAATAPATEPAPVAPPVGSATQASRDCVARVKTTPAGAQVFWGDLALGQSPLEQAAIPCGAGTLTFRRERYAELTRAIRAERGQNAIVEERLSRPPAKLVVTSTPPHALIKVNRSRFGPAPRRINTLRFEHIRVEASLPGYRPWKKTVYLRDADVKIDAELVPIAKPAARRATGAASAPARPR